MFAKDYIEKHLLRHNTLYMYTCARSVHQEPLTLVDFQLSQR